VTGQCYVELQSASPVYDSFAAAQAALETRMGAYEDLFTRVIRRVYPQNGQFIDFQSLEITALHDGPVRSLQARALIVNPDAEFYLHGRGLDLPSGQSLLLSCFSSEAAPNWLTDARRSLTPHVN